MSFVSRERNFEMKQWLPYKNSKTIGEIGSQGGVIVFDEEYADICRLTVEKFGDDSCIRICDIYNSSWRFRFFSSEESAINSCIELEPEMAKFIEKHPEGISDIGWSVFFEEC